MGHLFFFAVYLHIFRVILRILQSTTGNYLDYWNAYISGHDGYRVSVAPPWGQCLFGVPRLSPYLWGYPFIGEPIQIWLLGGPSVDNATLNRFYLHLSNSVCNSGIGGRSHLGFPYNWNNNPTGVEVDELQKMSSERHRAFLPYYVIKDL